MPTKTWEPPPRQSDSRISPRPGGMVEPRNSEAPQDDRGWNPDAPQPERGRVDYDEINLHGSER